MRNTSPQRYSSEGLALGVETSILDNAASTIRRIQDVNPNLYPLLTLNHLSQATGVSYGYLRKAVGREIKTYKHFMMKKRVPGRNNKRMISTPHERLLVCHQWISQNILSFAPAHHASFAYHPKSSPVFAAQVHVNAKWLIKVDIQDFFHAVSEHKVYRVFHSLGYSRLLSFELARLCTMPAKKHSGHLACSNGDSEYKIEHYQTPYIGILPQGAPTSPMLSNLVMREIDQALTTLASKTNMRYTRYADDIVFSCYGDREAKTINTTKRQILEILNKGGFRPNHRKTVVRGPGTRKIVLGLLVDGSRPRLTRDYKDMLRLHLHYLTHSDYGPAAHATARKTSISKIYHHILGKIYWARSVEPKFGNNILDIFNAVDWPPITKIEYFD